MTRKAERDELLALVKSSARFTSHVEAQRLVTVLLDGGFRNNKIVLEEFADYFAETGKAVGIEEKVVEHVPKIVRKYAQDLEDNWRRL